MRQPSRRSVDIPPFLVMDVLEKAQQMERAGRSVIHMEVGEPDFPTPDGTCVRDYVHVADLAAAHILGIDNLEKNTIGHYNLGNGNGFSNLDVVHAVKQVSGKEFDFKFGPRREGDPATLVASAEKAKKEKIEECQ